MKVTIWQLIGMCFLLRTVVDWRPDAPTQTERWVRAVAALVSAGIGFYLVRGLVSWEW